MYISFQKCNKCGETTQHLNGKCSKCTAKEFEKKEAEWKAKTNEEKIDILLKRIEKLERGEIKYGV